MPNERYHRALQESRSPWSALVAQASGLCEQVASVSTLGWYVFALRPGGLGAVALDSGCMVPPICARTARTPLPLRLSYFRRKCWSALVAQASGLC